MAPALARRLLVVVICIRIRHLKPNRAVVRHLRPETPRRRAFFHRMNVRICVVRLGRIRWNRSRLPQPSGGPPSHLRPGT
uniref:Zinc finger family protein n=1 Tax=Rhizophora mucronata TaxID=61149 RepID=A0A2P2IPZ2_RHIMU